MTFTDLPGRSLLRPDEVAKFLQVTTKTVLSWCAAGKFEWSQVAGSTTIRITRKSVIEALQRGRDRVIGIEPKEGPPRVLKTRRIIDRGISISDISPGRRK